MDWIECNKRRIVKQVYIDEAMIKSLLNTSTNKLKSEKILILNNTTASSKITLAYDALRELLEALALKNGFKIYNHECYTAFLKDVMNESSTGDEFDEIRKLRNSINYYGKEISVQDTRKTLKEIKSLIKKIKKRF